MHFLLVRVDDRLLHGQVVYGWAAELAPRGYMLVDDRAASDPWEAEAYQAAVAGEVPVEIRGLAAFACSWRETHDAEGTIVLLRDLVSLRWLFDRGFRPAGEINIGGVRGGPGSRELLPFLLLSEADQEILADLLRGGCPLYAQELPGAARHGGEALRAMLGE